MASDMSKMLKQAVKSCADEIEREEDKKIKIALSRTMQKVEEKLDEILQEYMVKAYYSGYSPVEYIRSHQLEKAVKSYTESYTSGTTMGFEFGALFDEAEMNHSTYKIKVKWYRKRKKEWVEQTYTITPEKRTRKVNELAILEAFQDGIHPNAVSAGFTSTPNGSPLFDDNKMGTVPEIIEAWVENGGIQDIFLEELYKLY